MNEHGMAQKTFHPRIGLLSTLEFCSHAFLEGLVIGFSFQLTFGLGVFVAFAVVSPDFCDGISTLTLMLNSGNTLKNSMTILLVDGSARASRRVKQLFFVIQNNFVYALSFLFGSFLYMRAGTLLPDPYRMNRPATTVILFLTGFFLIFLFTRILT